MFCIDPPIARISSSLVPGLSQWFFHFVEEFVIAWNREETMSLGGTEPHHSSWQCKKSHPCCHGPLAPLTMGDSGTSTLLTRYEYMRLRSLRQSEKTTEGNRYNTRYELVCYRAVNMEYQQRWTRWWCTMPSKVWQKVINWARKLRRNPFYFMSEDEAQHNIGLGYCRSEIGGLYLSFFLFRHVWLIGPFFSLF